MDWEIPKARCISLQALIQQKQKELELIERKIDHRLEQLQDAVESELDQISGREIPAGRIVWIRDSLKLNSYLDLEYAIQKLQKNQKEPLAFLGKVGVGISKENLEQGKFQKVVTEIRIPISKI